MSLGNRGSRAGRSEGATAASMAVQRWQSAARFAPVIWFFGVIQNADANNES